MLREAGFELGTGFESRLPKRLQGIISESRPVMGGFFADKKGLRFTQLLHYLAAFASTLAYILG